MGEPRVFENIADGNSDNTIGLSVSYLGIMEFAWPKEADGLAVTPQRGRHTVRQKNTTRILIVDEDELSLALIRASLETKQFEAFSAFNCEQALGFAASESLDLVICDFEVRADTGAQLQTLIQSVPRNAEVPFLFTSSSQIPDVISRRIGDRNVFLVRKPFEHEAFLELVEFAMWMPQLIRSHIESMHVKQGLKRPHLTPERKGVFPSVSLLPTGSLPTSIRSVAD